MKLWKVSCQEDKYPGMWQRSFREQCAGIGWSPEDGFHLAGPTTRSRGWSRAREAMKSMAVGDYLVVTLRGHRVGRLGEITGKAMGDLEWNPLVPKSKGIPRGEMGRRIQVRWDLMTGPDNRDLVVALPHTFQFTSGELRPTVAEIRSRTVDQLKATMNDPANWVGLLSHFDYERALAGYVAAYPHRLEDGLLPHPNDKLRERVFRDRSRLDVLLTDREQVPVIVECKQGQPTLDHLRQIRNYMERLKDETDATPRGILIHGGARKLRADVAAEAKKRPQVEIVQYTLAVEFIRSA
jgi:hypothetical protein